MAPKEFFVALLENVRTQGDVAIFSAYTRQDIFCCHVSTFASLVFEEGSTPTTQTHLLKNRTALRLQRLSRWVELPGLRPPFRSRVDPSLLREHSGRPENSKCGVQGKSNKAEKKEARQVEDDKQTRQVSRVTVRRQPRSRPPEVDVTIHRWPLAMPTTTASTSICRFPHFRSTALAPTAANATNHHWWQPRMKAAGDSTPRPSAGR